MGFRENIGDHHILIVTVRFYKNLLREPLILRLEEALVFFSIFGPSALSLLVHLVIHVITTTEIAWDSDR